MKLMTKFTLLVCMMLIFVSTSFAKTYAVLPFAIHAPEGYGYLREALQSTLSARLFWQDKVTPVTVQIPTMAVVSVENIKKTRSKINADVIVWGTATSVGDDVTLEVHALDKDGTTWTRTKQSSLGNLTNIVNSMAAELSFDLFQRPLPQAKKTSRNQGINQMNPDIVINETTQQEVYLNPQFRYQGADSGDGSRIHSARLPFTMVDFVVADLDGDGTNEIAILGDHKLHIYAWENGKLKPLAETTITMSNQNYSMRSIDLDRDGRQELIVSTFEDSVENRPTTYFYGYANNSLREVAKKVFYYVSVAKLPPTYEKVLIGQRWDSIRLFKPGVYLMRKEGDKYVLSNKVHLPEGANVFNFVWLPGGTNEGGDKIIMLNNKERLQVYTQAGSKMHLTMNNYSGSSVGMEHYKTVPGLGRSTNYELPSLYYAPMRMVAADLAHDGKFVLLVNRPISTASQFFDRYRFFPQGEIHALYWDGVGLGLKWKTRRIRGSVADLALGDLDNNGNMDLIVGLNTHPGALGLKSRQCIITAYPLDLSQTNPNLEVNNFDFE